MCLEYKHTPRLLNHDKLIRPEMFYVCLLALVALFVSGEPFVSPATAHTSNQAFVLLLPTDLYISSGVIAVIATILLLAIPGIGRLSSAHPRFALTHALSTKAPVITSLCSLVLLAFLIGSGMFGSRDPLANPLPLFIWTVWWIGFFTVTAFVGNIWRWVNPWTGLHTVILAGKSEEPLLRFPPWLDYWPAIAGITLFVFFMLAHPSPEDPFTLAIFVGSYWLFTYTGMILFGAKTWLKQCECFSVMLNFFASIAVFGIREKRICIGLPCWKLQDGFSPSILAAIFIIVMLGSSSFDGLNETFWWLVFLDINPLEYPGRSALVWHTIIGGIAANLILIGAFATCIYIGLRMVSATYKYKDFFCQCAPTLLPIAVGYHIAHFLPSFLVNSQYALATATDPMATGADYLHLGTFYVTTGFFNSKDSVRIIFLTQASAVVVGHILSILAAHAVALRTFSDNRRAFTSQIPLAMFMIAYTFFGLWLLATPRGA